MKYIKRAYFGLFLTLTLLWLCVDRFVPNPFDFFTMRRAWVNYTGILAMGAMSIIMILSLRTPRIEAWLDGLDKSYRLHKWLGISALVLGLIHWTWTKGVKWMVGWGWLVRPPRRAPSGQPPLTGLLGFLDAQRKLAESIGEWTFYAAAILIILALLKRIPYSFFYKTHRLLPIAYLLLVFHSLVLIPIPYWQSPIAYVMLALMLMGSFAALCSFFGKIGAHRKTTATITSLKNYSENKMTAVIVTLQAHWPGHQAGQFAYVTFDPKEGAHPFTIASAWENRPEMTFLIKSLGDYTQELPSTLKVGDQLHIEGPYGYFNFESKAFPSTGVSSQIWIGGGVGVTPFIARMQALAQAPQKQAVDFFYAAPIADSEFIPKLTALAQQAGVRLHLFIDQYGQRLTPEKIQTIVPEWQKASFWFCGPWALGNELKQTFLRQGLKESCFHRELFVMR